MLSYTKLSLNRQRLSLLRNMATATSKNLVEFHVHGNARTVTLNRPDKLNALNTEMCDAIIPRLVEFSKSKSANLILIKSSTERAFCSGGDVVQCAKFNLDNHSKKSLDFFKSEYNLNYLLSIYGKPIVSLVNGIVMGGGVGLSVHGPFRVVTETTRFAMPETSIGFFNDVGTSFWLPKLDANLGYYLSLTGDELIGFDTLLAGFGTHYVPLNRFTELTERLSALELPVLATDRRKNTIFNRNNSEALFPIVNSLIEEFSIQIPKNHQFKYSLKELNTIERCFDPNTQKSVKDIIKALEDDGSSFALETIQKLRSKSPLSLELNFKLLLKNKDASIQEALSRELKLAGKLMTNYRDNDFNSFINNKLIEKNKTPITSTVYKTIDDVSTETVSELISLDVYNPKVPSSSNEVEAKDQLENEIELLNSLKIGNFNELGERVSNFNQYPHHMGLPTQAEIEAYVKGTEESKDEEVMVTFKETLDYFQMKYDNKAGVDAKVKMVLNRKTQPSPVDSEYIQWVN